jgi:gelsolin
MDITEIDISNFIESEELAEHMAKLAAKAEAFLASCGKDDLEVYRIEHFDPIKQPKESFGQFFQGDSYVIVKQNEGDYEIHFWHGKDCTTDEMGSSAAFSVQLSSNLSKDSNHNLELQGHESDLFLSYFRNGV